MKYTKLLVTLSLFSILSLSGLAQANQPLSKCGYDLYRNTDGTWIAGGSFYVRQSKASRLEIAPIAQSFEFSVTQERSSPDDVYNQLFSPKATTPRFFVPQGMEAKFGDALYFGFIKCDELASAPFYFVSNKNQVVVSDRGTDINLYSVLTTPGACVSGDLGQASASLEKYWYMPIENLRATAQAITWTEVIKDCPTAVASSDHPGYDCPGGLRELSRREITLPACSSAE